MARNYPQTFRLCLNLCWCLFFGPNRDLLESLNNSLPLIYLTLSSSLFLSPLISIACVFVVFVHRRHKHTFTHMQCTGIRDRSKSVELWTGVAQYCLLVGNYNSATAILESLESPAIARLHTTVSYYFCQNKLRLPPFSTKYLSCFPENNRNEAPHMFTRWFLVFVARCCVGKCWSSPGNHDYFASSCVCCLDKQMLNSTRLLFRPQPYRDLALIYCFRTTQQLVPFIWKGIQTVADDEPSMMLSTKSYNFQPPSSILK